MISIIRGITFSVESEKSVLYEILKCIDIVNYCWYNIYEQNEVWNNKTKEEFFEKDYYDGNDFENVIQSEYCIIFYKVQAYLKKGNFNNIHTFQEFLESECQILLLIYDCSFVEIYVKDSVVLNNLYHNAIKNGYKKVRYITDENDNRTRMDVL